MRDIDKKNMVALLKIFDGLTDNEKRGFLMGVLAVTNQEREMLKSDIYELERELQIH